MAVSACIDFKFENCIRSQLTYLKHIFHDQFMDANTEAATELPALPEPHGQRPWPADVYDAHRRLRILFSSARSALNLDESDPIRLRFHLHRSTNLMLPLIRALGFREEQPLPSAHIELLAQHIGTLIIRLRNMLDGSEIRYEDNLFHDITPLSMILKRSVNIQRCRKYNLLR